MSVMRTRTPTKEDASNGTTDWEGIKRLCNIHAVVVVFVCAAYLVTSSLLILLNKYLLSMDGFKYPLILSGSGMVMSNIGASILVQFPALVPDRQPMTMASYCKKILPLGFCSAATLAFGNVAYLYLDVGLLQMMKSCCPVFVLFVAFAFRLENFTVPLMASILLIAGGTATTATTGIQSVSVVGLVIQFTSELCEAVRLCLAQMLMCNLRLHQFETLRLMSSASVLFLALGVWVLEWKQFWENKAWLRIAEHPHWYLAAAMLGFGLNLLAFAVIKLTGSLTQKVLGTIKNVLLVVFSVMFMGETVSTMQLLGYQTSLAGFVWFQWQKLQKAASAAVLHQSPRKSLSHPLDKEEPPLISPHHQQLRRMHSSHRDPDL